jgi:glycosyltransferase involved in cell wall biosynthesis
MIAHILSAPKKVPLFRLLRLGRSIDRILVYSSWQRRFVHQQLGYPEDHVILTSFMVDTRYFDGRDHDAPPERMICAAGLERRDYATLLEAVRDLDVKVVIGAASPWSKQGDSTEGRALPENVEVRRLDFVELRDLYARSMFVVVPLHDVEFQAGVTTILEAMGMGKAVICSRTVGQTDVVVDEQTGIYVTPGDAAELRAAIKRLLGDPDRARSLGAAARAYVERECDVTAYARRLAGIAAGVRTQKRREECAACQPSA